MNKVEQINYRHNPFTYKIEWEHSMEHDHTFFEIVLIIRFVRRSYRQRHNKPRFTRGYDLAASERPALF